MPDPSVIDSQVIKNLAALNPDDKGEFLREIINIYLEDTPLRIAELDESFAAADVQKFTRAAHSVKGSSANLGATALRAVAEKLENNSRQNGLTGAIPLVAALKAEYARASAELRKLLQAP